MSELIINCDSEATGCVYKLVDSMVTTHVFYAEHLYGEGRYDYYTICLAPARISQDVNFVLETIFSKL